MKRTFARSSGDSDSSDMGLIRQPVLGRSVFLGSLFDAKENEVYVSHTIWSVDTIESNKLTIPKKYSNVEFFAANTKNEKTGMPRFFSFQSLK